MRTSTAAHTATVILGLEAAGVLVLAIWQVLELMAGAAEWLASALALIVLTLIAAAAVAAFAVGVARDVSWGRSGGIVTQLLIVAVAIGAATGAYAHPLIGLALAAVAVVALIPLVLEVRRAGIARRAAEHGDDEDR
ncbi:hypothetical protein GCM10022240_20450 [Microbacterium kribbense]|uniref:Histidine kinase n=1 Tax=Microbacterium kribbense TaxID=433645 RepID=A0ABP7GL14_9MICO